MSDSGGDLFKSHNGVEWAADKIRRASPESFSVLVVALKAVRDKEMEGLLRAGGSDELLLAQGRARMIDKILSCVEHHQFITDKRGNK